MCQRLALVTPRTLRRDALSTFFAGMLLACTAATSTSIPGIDPMALSADNIYQDLQDIGSSSDSSDDLIDWRQRYEGVLMVAYLDGKAVAGISGPWPVNQYALTWWDRPVPSRQLELFDSFEAAQQRVEE